MSFVSRLAGAPEEQSIDSIARNLEALLNAKKGYAGAVEVFGLGNYNAHLADKALTDALIAEMLDQVRQHEPRLREPKIVLRGRDQGLWVCFSITGRVDQQTVSFAVRLHSVFRNVRVDFEAR
jgi:type VI secretion system protein